MIETMCWVDVCNDHVVILAEELLGYWIFCPGYEVALLAPWALVHWGSKQASMVFTAFCMQDGGRTGGIFLARAVHAIVMLMRYAMLRVVFPMSHS